MFDTFDKYVRRLRGERQVKNGGAVVQVGDWYVEDGTSYVCYEVSHEGGRFEVDVVEVEPLTSWTRAGWILLHVALVVAPTMWVLWGGWLWYG